MSSRKITAILVAVALLCLNLNTAIPAQVEKRLVLAVMPLPADEGTEVEARQVTVQVIDHIKRAGDFIVLEYVHSENALQDLGHVLNSEVENEMAIRAGKMLSADIVITGTLGREGDTYDIRLEMIDVASGQVKGHSAVRCKLGFQELPATMNALLDPLIYPESAGSVPDPKDPEKEAVEVAREDVDDEEEKLAEDKEAEEDVLAAHIKKDIPHETTKPEPEKPVVKTRPAVEPQPKKGGFMWLIGALAAGGGVAVALLAGGKDSGPSPPTHGSIQVNSNPTGAKIFHNGSDTGRVTNSTLANLLPGTHTIKLVREGYVDMEGQIGVTAGQTATFSRTLTRHTISVGAPAAGTTWVPGQEVEIRWTTGGGAAVHSAESPESTFRGAGVLDGGIDVQRVAVREQAINRRMGAGERMSYGGVTDDRAGGEGLSVLRGRAGGRTDSQAENMSQSTVVHGAAGSAQSTSARSADGSAVDHARGRLVTPSAASEFSGAMISGKPAVQDDSRVLVLSSVGIKLYRGSTEIRTIIARTNNTGSYKWTIPADQTQAGGYKVRIFCADATEVYGDSGSFTIERRRNETIRGIEMVYIPPGEFMMGSNEGYSDERPVHRVRITKAFWIGKYPVTQKQWRDVMGSNPSHFRKGDNYPVERVSWDDIQGFITRLNQLTRRGFRLPTEAEWEYACRAGTTGERYGNLNNIAWYRDNSGSSTQPVGRKQPNGFGLYDMLGNVREWVRDWYDSTYYSRSPINDPAGPSSGSRRVERGGSWNNGSEILRSACRGTTYGSSPSTRSSDLGFRLARTN